MKVLMVCLGNICRSPIAEGILRHKAAERGLAIEVDSAGTSSFHAGNPPDLRMMITARKNGIDITDLRSRLFVKEDFQNFDLIFAMDQSNERNILSLAENDEDRQKVKLILNEIDPTSNSQVPDPYYGGDHGFQVVIDLLDKAIDKFLNRLDGQG
ncbi:MAG: low molecular weight phosphotyrosine protein phosphatase [Crocinitomix sp.]|nr:low molecular weight phosphotyrosine protein phosphatase [Crocinitomix sp.]